MLNRVLITAALALGALALPAAASADDYVPGEVIVHYEDGTSGAVTDTLQDATGTVTEQALPGGSDQLAIEDGDSVRRRSPSSSASRRGLRGAELARARRGGRDERSRLAPAVEPVRGLRHQSARGLGPR